MPILPEFRYSIAQPLFQGLGTFHLCGWAVLCGVAPGSVWVDDPDHPHVGFLESSEGFYLAGDPGCTAAYPALKKAIPQFAYLICDPPKWEQVLGQVWSNVAARRHEREHHVFRGTQVPQWQDWLPEGYRLLPLDRDFFAPEHAARDLEHFDDVTDWVGGWRSLQDFLERGVGAAVVNEDTIVSWSVMDCALDERCEIGIVTDRRYRRRGFARLVVSAVVEMCLARGYQEIGWQCLRSNKGSIGTARAVGFQKERDYLAFSSFIPAETATDLSSEEYADWAMHYERFLPEHPWTAFEAAQAWAMAGRPARALENLRFLKQTGWKARPEWINHNWRLENLLEIEEAAKLLTKITA